MSIVQRVGKTKAKTKAEFVRRYPKETAKEIVLAAKAVGMRIEPSYVYNVRAYDEGARKKAVKKPAKLTAAVHEAAASAKSVEPFEPGMTWTNANGVTFRILKKGISTNGASRDRASSFEEVLKAAASEVGLSNAMQILHAERERGQAVMMGVG